MSTGVLVACLLAVTSAQAARPASGSDGRSATAAVTEVDRASGFAQLQESLRQADFKTDVQKAVRECIASLAASRLPQASRHCNAALKLETSNSQLHLLNAIVYHAMAMDGDAEKLPLAEQGYQLALQFDKSNWHAHYFLGALYFEQRRFGQAQSSFAEALLFEPKDADCLIGLAAASYQARDPATAASALSRVPDAHKRRPSVMRTAAVAYAAAGDRDQAQYWLAQARELGLPAAQMRQLESRVAQWLDLHASQASKAPTMRTVQATLPADPNAAPPAATPAPAPYVLPPQAPDISNNMVLIDVVMLKMEDTLSTRKGVNLLGSLNLQFGNANIGTPAWTRGSQHIKDGAGTHSSNTTVTRAITVPALTYSLNIVNSNSNLNEVLARPTIAALNGVKSEFFSGSELNAAVVAQGATSGGAAVQIQKEVGVKLGVTPTFLSDRKVRLVVDAQRTFLKPPSQDINFTFKIETSKINVASNVVLEFGETLVLGGLSEKETSKVRDGVPFFQDVPGLQYLLSEQENNEFQRSVIMLITPREPYYTFRPDELGAYPGAEAAGAAGAAAALSGPDAFGSRVDPGVRQLRARYGDWFAPYPSLESVFNHLGKTGLYREFRTGDVSLERWDRQQSTFERLKQSLDFLYF